MAIAGRRWLWVLFLCAGAAPLLGWNGWEYWRDRSAMADVHEEIEHGRHSTAALKLTALLARQPDWDEALYLLGACELERGRPGQADAAWGRVPPASPFAARAVMGRMEIRMVRGQYAAAERMIGDIKNDPRFDAPALAAVLRGPLSRRRPPR